MGLLKRNQFLRPSEWLRAIPLIQEELAVISLQTTTLETIDNLQDWLTILKKILREEVYLRRFSSSEVEEPYSIRMSGVLFGRLTKLLYIRPLTEEDLSQVRAGCGPAKYNQ